MNIIYKEIEFDYGHRVALHETFDGKPGKCSSCHGHRGKVIAYLSGKLFESGPQTQMIFDYGFLKNLLVENIDAHCDHAMILSFKDEKFMGMAYSDRLTKEIYIDWHNNIKKSIKIDSFWFGQTNFGKTYIIADYPTAESLAKHFFEILRPKILVATNNQARLDSIVFKETPTSGAEYKGNYVD